MDINEWPLIGRIAAAIGAFTVIGAGTWRATKPATDRYVDARAALQVSPVKAQIGELDEKVDNLRMAHVSILERLDAEKDLMRETRNDVRALVEKFIPQA